jgi:hypothetical protein
MYSVIDAYGHELTPRTDHDTADAAFDRLRPTSDVWLVYWLSANSYNVVRH